MPVNPNRSAPTSWISECPDSSKPDEVTLRRHGWEETEIGEWECQACGISVAPEYFRWIGIADVITPTSLDVAVSIWIDYNRNTNLAKQAMACPRY